MPIRTLLVEDEPLSMARLREVLEAMEDVEIVGEASDGPAAAVRISELRPDLVFLDIHMPGCDGFEVLARASHRPLVVFVTAYDQHALKAFEANAVDYLLKPSSRERIREAVQRAVERRQAPGEDLLQALRAAVEKRRHLRRFLVKVGDEILVVPESEVLCFRAEDKYVTLVTEGRAFITDFTLKELEEQLDPERFARVHKSAIVALDRVKQISRWFHGDQMVLLDDRAGTRLRVSRSYAEGFRRRMG